MVYSKITKQLKTYRLNTVFIVSLKFLEHGYYEFGEFGEFGGIRTPCISINNINSTPYEILCLIYNSRDMQSMVGVGRVVGCFELKLFFYILIYIKWSCYQRT